MTEPDEAGYDSPEDAARGDIPERFVTILGVRIEGDAARVWILTNDRPPFEPYEVDCVREGDRWQWTDGHGSVGHGVPPEVLEEAARHGWE